MKMKKFALRGLVTLAVVVALCIFFSGTIRTLTTPKVRFAQAKMGKMEMETELTGKVVFPEEEEFRISVPEGMSLTVTRVYKNAGDKVKEGDTLISARVTDGEKTMENLRKEAETAQKELREQEKKLEGVRLTSGEQRWEQAWKRENEIRIREMEARVSLMSSLRRAGLELNEKEELPEEAGEEQRTLWESWRQVSEELRAASEELTALERYTIPDETWNAMQARDEQKNKIADLEEQMLVLQVLEKTGDKITAPRDAYVSEVSVEKGSTVDGDTVILKLTAEGKDPVIRVDLSDVKQEVAKGSSLTVISDSWSNPSAKVLDVGLSADGHPYADAEINKDVTYALGNVAAMMKNDIRVKLITRSQESTCLLPAAAVRGSGDSRYVYVGETESSTFGGTRMIARKTDVKVLAESGSTASVAEDLSWAKVLYMEDRALTDGCAVMEYAKESNQ